MPLSVGDQAPEFTLPDQQGKYKSLRELLKNGPLVLFFYPKDDSPGCTRQACSFRDNYEMLVSRGISVAGISKDSEQDHRSFIEKHQLPYPLLVDKNGRIHNEYRCQTLFGMLTRRITYLIDTNSTILLAHEDNFRMGSHVDAVLKLLASKAEKQQVSG